MPLVFAAEALAVFHRLQFAVDMGFLSIVLENDTTVIIQKLKVETKDLSEISAFISEAEGLSQTFLECCFAFVDWSANRAMHALT